MYPHTNVYLHPLLQSTRGVKRVTEAEYKAALNGLAESAFDDPCTSANPRYPLISDLRTILEEAYDAPITPVKTLEFHARQAAPDDAGEKLL